jgi:hypothetical protein
MLPIDVYNALISSTAPSSGEDGTSGSIYPPSVLSPSLILKTGTNGALENSKEKIVKIKKNKRLNPDAKNLQYNQEFNRYKKFKTDLEENPIGDKMLNLFHNLSNLQSKSELQRKIVSDDKVTANKNNMEYQEPEINETISQIERPSTPLTSRKTHKSYVNETNIEKKRSLRTNPSKSKIFTPYKQDNEYNRGTDNTLKNSENHLLKKSKNPTSKALQTGEGIRLYTKPQSKFKPQLW